MSFQVMLVRCHQLLNSIVLSIIYISVSHDIVEMHMRTYIGSGIESVNVQL